MDIPKNTFIAQNRKKVLFSSDFKDFFLLQQTSLIEQRIVINILSAIKDEQSLFISAKSQVPNISNNKNLSFDEYFEGYANQGEIEFILPLDKLNPNRKMKNSVIKTALVNMSNINWFTLKDESIDGFMAVPFIICPKWNKKNLFFKIDKAVIKFLLNMAQYYQIRSDLPYTASTPNTLKFVLWLMKHKGQEAVKKEYYQLLNELFINKNKYENRSKFERDFLKIVKADLDACNDLSFNYSYLKGVYYIVIYFTKNSVGKLENFKSIEELRIYRSIKYLQRKRNLKDNHIRFLKQLYLSSGYEIISSKIKCKIDKNLEGEDYIKAIFSELNK